MPHRQPDFVIIGATKSATTWLQRNLQQHTTVFMPGPETHYFSRFFERGPAWYENLFKAAKPHQILGEKSTSYLDHPDAPQRLRDALPDARLIVQLRNPVDRAYADYCQHYRAGRVGEDVDHYLGGDSLEAEQLRAGGLYFPSIARFLDLFPREQLCVTLYDDLDREPANVLNRIREHIGLATTDAGAAARELQVEDDHAPEVPLPARRLLAPLKGLVQPFRETLWFRATRGLIARPVRYPELGDAVRARLRAYYEEDVRKLSELLGRDLGLWMSPSGARV
jgi:Sulfotransferase domain